MCPVDGSRQSTSAAPSPLKSPIPKPGRLDRPSRTTSSPHTARRAAPSRPSGRWWDCARGCPLAVAVEVRDAGDLPVRAMRTEGSSGGSGPLPPGAVLNIQSSTCRCSVLRKRQGSRTGTPRTRVRNHRSGNGMSADTADPDDLPVGPMRSRSRASATSCRSTSASRRVARCWRCARGCRCLRWYHRHRQGRLRRSANRCQREPRSIERDQLPFSHHPFVELTGDGIAPQHVARGVLVEVADAGDLPIGLREPRSIEPAHWPAAMRH